MEWLAPLRGKVVAVDTAPIIYFIEGRSPYREILLKARHFLTFDLTAEIAEEAARIRADYNLGTPDAIQLATATRNGAAFLLTNDKALAKFSGISVITLADVAGDNHGA